MTPAELHRLVPELRALLDKTLAGKLLSYWAYYAPPTNQPNSQVRIGWAGRDNHRSYGQEMAFSQLLIPSSKIILDEFARRLAAFSVDPPTPTPIPPPQTKKKRPSSRKK